MTNKDSDSSFEETINQLEEEGYFREDRPMPPAILDIVRFNDALLDICLHEVVEPAALTAPSTHDLKTELLPSYVSSVVGDAEIRSRDLVSSFDNASLRKILTDIDSFIKEQFEHYRTPEEHELATEASEAYENNQIDGDETLSEEQRLIHKKIVRSRAFYAPIKESRFSQLSRLHREGVSYQAITSVEGADWTVLFATVARGLLEIAILRQTSMFEQAESDGFLNKFVLVYNSLTNVINAINESVTTAVVLAAGEEKYKSFIKNLNETNSENARSGGLAKRDKYLPLKKEVIRIYDGKYQSKSNRQAGVLVAQNIDPSFLVDETGRQLIQDPEDRFAKWIGKYLKGTLSV